MLGLVKKIFGDSNEREIKKMFKRVEKINALEPSISALTDEQLREKTTEFKNRLAQGETLPWCARPPSACSACAILTYS
jgi:preprotein translocase subunit SecA